MIAVEGMIANEETHAPIHEASSEEEALLERSSAPTLRDLRGAAEDMSKTMESEPDPTSPNDRLPKRAA